jgi:hypothetical protein
VVTIVTTVAAHVFFELSIFLFAHFPNFVGHVKHSAGVTIMSMSATAMSPTTAMEKSEKEK